MDFLYFFDILDFDENGKVCASKTVEVFEAQSNFLYLVAKYNHFFLKNEKLPLSDFFKEELSQLLIDLEIGEKTFDQARAQVLENCLPKVQALAKLADKNLVLALNESIDLETISKTDKDLAVFMKKFSLLSNGLEKANKLTRASGKRFGNIIMLLQDKQAHGNLSKEDKSQMFKDIITYNALVKKAEKIANSNFEKGEDKKTSSKSNVTFA